MRPRSRAFTLIELLVVLIIIAVIISIVLPALWMARRATRTAATHAMLTNISNAAGSFINDNRRTPGYFTAAQMGDSQNYTQGFTGMQNVMLDLAGWTTNPGGGNVTVGPGTTPNVTQIDIELDAPGPGPTFAGTANGTPRLLAGSSNTKSYFVPDAKHWKRQDGGNQQVGTAQNCFLASVIDDFGNPVLAWAADDTAVGQIDVETKFAKATSNGAPAGAARFYWAANAAHLSAMSLGSRGYDQTDQNRGSMIGSTSPSTPTPPATPLIEKSLCGLLGSPSFPYRAPGSTTPPTVPAAPRGSLVLHSAGGDGIFLGMKDRGAKQFWNGWVDYTASFVNSAGVANTDKDGKVETVDITKAFDDIIVAGGN
jgi:prepilin-type N-terminal cleavage/methylation domain-containing protein